MRLVRSEREGSLYQDPIHLVGRETTLKAAANDPLVSGNELGELARKKLEVCRCGVKIRPEQCAVRLHIVITGAQICSLSGLVPGEQISAVGVTWWSQVLNC